MARNSLMIKLKRWKFKNSKPLGHTELLDRERKETNEGAPSNLNVVWCSWCRAWVPQPHGVWVPCLKPKRKRKR